MKPLVSAIIPTRNRSESLATTMNSLLSTAKDPDRIQFVLKFDDDDAQRLKEWPRNVKVVVTPRGAGYTDMPRFVYEACAVAEGVWSFLIDDDAWIEGRDWDEQLAQIEPVRCVVQCEFYHLGMSRYGSNSCGPNGLFFPHDTYKLMNPKIGGAADVQLCGNTVDSGWPKHLLKGIAYCHDGRAR